MTQIQLHQYTVSREILHLARQLNLRTAGRQIGPAEIRTLTERLVLLCRELELTSSPQEKAASSEKRRSL